jgi:hypothetical protein
MNSKRYSYWEILKVFEAMCQELGTRRRCGLYYYITVPKFYFSSESLQSFQGPGSPDDSYTDVVGWDP